MIADTYNRPVPYRPRRLNVLVAIALVLGCAWLWSAMGVTPRAVVAQTVEATQRVHEAAAPSRETQIGVLKAHQRLGRGVPLGRGVAVGHVEGGVGSYMPSADDGNFRNVTFVPHSGPSTTFDHAQIVAKVFYGRAGFAPGVTTVHSWTTMGWLTDYLKAGTADPPSVADSVDAAEMPRVFNHSWIGQASPGAEQALRRLDYVIDEHDVIHVVGVNNGEKAAVPALLGSAYNAIAVGVSSGKNSGGYTKFDGEGRCKPDIVAPHELTSYSTPIVAAICARLVEAAETMKRDAPSATKAEVIKAVLMAGATKPDGWAPEMGKPLDSHLGVGEVNLDHALRVLQSGPAEPGALKQRYGWAFRALPPGEAATYRFAITQPLGESSIVLTWHRRVDGQMSQFPGGGIAWLPVPRVADFDLRLIKVETGGASGGSLRTVGFSSSGVDNVEHVYLPQLDPGEYVIEVRRQTDGNAEPWEFAAAWRFEKAGDR